jgi:hypothetical protein
MAETETVKPGDCIVFKRADSMYDAFKIHQAENRVSVRRGIKELSDACEIARTSRGPKFSILTPRQVCLGNIGFQIEAQNASGRRCNP